MTYKAVSSNGKGDEPVNTTNMDEEKEVDATNNDIGNENNNNIGGIEKTIVVAANEPHSMSFIATGAWHDSRGRRHNFKIDTDTAERRFIKEIVESQYPAHRVVVDMVRPNY